MNTSRAWHQVGRGLRVAGGLGLLIAGVIKAWEPWLAAATISKVIGIRSGFAVASISAIEVFVACNLLVRTHRRWAIVGGVIGTLFLSWHAFGDSLPCGCFGAAQSDGLALLVGGMLGVQSAFAFRQRSTSTAVANPRRRLGWIASMLCFGLACWRIEGEELWQVIMRERGLLDGVVVLVEPGCDRCVQYVESARGENDVILVVRSSVMEAARTAWPGVPSLGVSDALWWQWCESTPPAVYRLQAGRIDSPR